MYQRYANQVSKLEQTEKQQLKAEQVQKFP